jgi:hypothetical protein
MVVVWGGALPAALGGFALRSNQQAFNWKEKLSHENKEGILSRSHNHVVSRVWLCRCA